MAGKMNDHISLESPKNTKENHSHPIGKEKVER